MTYGRELPHSDEAEISVLGGMMIDPEAADLAIEMLETSDFYHEAHGLLFEAIGALREEGHSADGLSVREKLKELGTYLDAGGDEHLVKIIDIVPTSANVRYHARVVRDHSQRRRLIKAAERIQEQGFEGESIADIYDASERELFSVTQAGLTEGDGLVGADKLVTSALERIMAGETNRVSSGFKAIDSVTGGLGMGELFILAARPSMGKTALGFQIASNVALGKESPVAIFSLEMGRDIAMTRLLATASEVNLANLSQGRGLDPRELEALDEAAKHLRESPIYIDDSALNIFDLTARARRHRTQHGIELVVVDYLQLMEGSGDSRTEAVGSVSRGLKRLAGELEVPVLCLAQLNRGVESRDNKRPRLSDLRDSGEIEQDADVVAFLYRESYYDPTLAEATGKGDETEIIFAKNRNGPTGTEYLQFIEEYTLFRDKSPIQEHGW